MADSRSQRKAAALAVSESLEDSSSESEDLQEDERDSERPPPPSYTEAVTLSMTAGIPEPPSGFQDHEDDMNDLLNRVKEQRADLKAEVGSDSEESYTSRDAVPMAAALDPDDVKLEKKESIKSLKKQEAIEMASMNSDDEDQSEEEGGHQTTVLPELRRLSHDLESEDDYSPQVTSRTEGFEIDETDVEGGRRTRPERMVKYDIGRLRIGPVPLPIPFLRQIINFVVRRYHYFKDHWPEWTTQKRSIVVFAIIFVTCGVLLAAFLPPSIVYVDYDKMGFLRNRVSGAVDYDRVYDYGCHFVPLTHETLLFPATAQFLDLDVSVFSKEGLTIDVEIYLQYFLRPSELADLYRGYNVDYHKIISLVAESALKNQAIGYSLDEFRLNRSMVEAGFFQKVKYALAGDCCGKDPHKGIAPHVEQSVRCNASKECYRGKHVELPFFQMGAITIPNKILDRYLRQVLLELELEREFYIQEKAVQVKMTALSIQNIENGAKEIREKAVAESEKIKTVSLAKAFMTIEKSYANAMKKTYSQLNVTDENVKTSLMYMKTLKDNKDNLVSLSYGYDNSLLSP